MIETLLEFPCRFPIKVMGRDTPAFRPDVLTIITEHAGEIPKDDVRMQPSSKGSFVSLTVTITAESRQQLDDVYLALQADEQVMMVL
jgi:hypothetical protein